MSNRTTCTNHSQRSWKAGNSSHTDFDAVSRGRRTRSRSQFLRRMELDLSNDEKRALLLEQREERRRRTAEANAQRQQQANAERATKGKRGIFGRLLAWIRTGF